MTGLERSSGRVSGSEQVRVPAGSFDALKVELLSSRAASGNPTTAAVEPVTVRFQAWYAPSAKRYVKMVRVMRSAANRQLEEDTIELLAHRQP